MAGTSKKLQLLAELLSEEDVLQLIAQQLGQFVIIGPDEPENGPCLWFDTSGSDSTSDTTIYFVLGEDTDTSDVMVEVEDKEYPVLNADSPVLTDDGNTVAINVSE